MTGPDDGRRPPSLLSRTGLPYFVIAFVARLPFAMMVVGVLTIVVSVRGSLSLGGLTSAAVGLGTACFGPLLGAAADRFGQRRVLLVTGAANGVLLALFAWVTYSTWTDAAMLAAAYLIGATAPQVSPLSRSRLVAIIAEVFRPPRHEKVFNATMAYESAADETVFIIGPFVVGLLASLIAPWAPLVGAGALTVVFVGAFALHPTSPPPRSRAHGVVVGPVTELFRPALIVVVVGILGVGLFFGTMLTALTAFMDDRGLAEQAGLLYGVMGIGSATFALGIALFPARFPRWARWTLFAGILFCGTLTLPRAAGVGGMTMALAVIGVGVGPTLVTQYSIGAERSPQGRSATVMTVLGSAVIVGQAAGAALTGEVAQGAGTSAALLLPAASALVVVVSGLANVWLTARENRRGRQGAGTRATAGTADRASTARSRLVAASVSTQTRAAAPEGTAAAGD